MGRVFKLQDSGSPGERDMEGDDGSGQVRTEHLCSSDPS